MKKNNFYKVTVKVQNGLGVLARMTIMLRKFNVNIHSMDAKPIDKTDKFYHIHFTLESKKNEKEMGLVIEKLARLIPVIKVNCAKI